MQIKVTVIKGVPKLVAWAANDTRKAGSMRVQEAWLHTVEPDGAPSFAPARFEIVLDRERADPTTGEIISPEQKPYVPGVYELHPSSVYLDRNGRPALSVRLAPVGKP